MLILTRRVGETVMIGDEVTVTVLRVKGNQVRLGVNAPKSDIGAARGDLPAHQARRCRATPRAGSDELDARARTAALANLCPCRTPSV